MSTVKRTDWADSETSTKPDVVIALSRAKIVAAGGAIEVDSENVYLYFKRSAKKEEVLRAVTELLNEAAFLSADVDQFLDELTSTDMMRSLMKMRT